MIRRLLASYLLLVAGVLLVLDLPLGVLYARHERAAVQAQAARDATAIAVLAQGHTAPDRVGDLATLIDRYRDTTRAEVLVVDASGAVILARRGRVADDADSAPPPVIAQALRGHEARGAADDDGKRWLIAAEPIATAVHPEGAVAVSLPAEGADNRIRLAWTILAALAAFALSTAGIVGWRLARSVTKPLGDLTQAAIALGAGDLERRAATNRGPREVRVLAREVNDAAARLTDMIDAQRRFVADASHQLRTPLTALRLRIENLDPSPSGDDPAVQAALVEADRLTRLLDGLLILSRTSGRRPPLEPVDAGLVARQRADAWSALAEEQDVALALDVPDTASVAMAPTGHLDQILDNLLANALDFSPPGSTIDLTVHHRGARVEIGVRDQGPGMDGHQRDHAFDRWWQGRHRTGSSGLGLAIVHELVTSARGDIRLLEAPGGGLHAELTLVAAQAS